MTLEQKNRDSTDVYDALSLKLKNETKTISREMAKVRILKDLLIKERGKKTSNSTEVKRLETELKTKVGEITLKSEELQNTQKALADIRKQMVVRDDELSTANTSLSTVRKERAELKTQLMTREEEVDELKIQNQLFQDRSEELADELKTAQQTNIDASQERIEREEQTRKDIEDIENINKDLTRQKEEAESLLANERKDNEKSKSSLVKMETEQNENLSKMDELREEVNKMKNESSTLEKELKTSKKQKNKARKVLTKTEKKLERFADKIKELTEQVDTSEKAHEIELGKVKEEIVVLRNELSTNKDLSTKEKSELEADLSTIIAREKKMIITHDLNIKKKDDQIIKLETESEQDYKTISDLQKQVKTFESEIEELETNVDQLGNKEIQLNLQIDKFIKDISENEQKIKDLEKKIRSSSIVIGNNNAKITQLNGYLKNSDEALERLIVENKGQKDELIRRIEREDVLRLTISDYEELLREASILRRERASVLLDKNKVSVPLLRKAEEATPLTTKQEIFDEEIEKEADEITEKIEEKMKKEEDEEAPTTTTIIADIDDLKSQRYYSTFTIPELREIYSEMGGTETKRRNKPIIIQEIIDLESIPETEANEISRRRTIIHNMYEGFNRDSLVEIAQSEIDSDVGNWRRKWKLVILLTRVALNEPEIYRDHFQYSLRGNAWQNIRVKSYNDSLPDESKNLTIGKKDKTDTLNFTKIPRGADGKVDYSKISFDDMPSTSSVPSSSVSSSSVSSSSVPPPPPPKTKKKRRSPTTNYPPWVFRPAFPESDRKEGRPPPGPTPGPLSGEEPTSAAYIPRDLLSGRPSTDIGSNLSRRYAQEARRDAQERANRDMSKVKKDRWKKRDRRSRKK